MKRRSEVEVRNSTFVNYQAAFYGCAWCVAHRGGYEIELWNVTMLNVVGLLPCAPPNSLPEKNEEAKTKFLF